MTINTHAKQLLAFTTIYELQSFTQAAKHLNITQPTLSNQIRMLEQALGVTLFDRTTRNLAITDIGKMVLENAYLVLNTLKRIEDNIHLNRQGIVGHVRVGAILSAYAIVLPPVVQRFSEKYPNIKVELVEASADEIHPMLNTNKIDIAICDQNFECDGYSYQHLYYDDLMLVCHEQHPLANKAQCHFDDINQLPFITMSGNTNIRPLTEKYFLSNGSKLQPVFNAEFQSTTLSLIKQNLGVSILPKSTIQLMNCDGVSFIPISDPIMHNSIGLLSAAPKPAFNTATVNFINEIDNFIKMKANKLL